MPPLLMIELLANGIQGSAKKKCAHLKNNSLRRVEIKMAWIHQRGVVGGDEQGLSRSVGSNPFVLAWSDFPSVPTLRRHSCIGKGD